MTESPMTFILLQIETVENLTKRLEELEKNSIVTTADGSKEEKPQVLKNTKKHRKELATMKSFIVASSYCFILKF